MTAAKTLAAGAFGVVALCLLALVSLPWMVWMIGRELRGDPDWLDSWTPMNAATGWLERRNAA